MVEQSQKLKFEMKSQASQANFVLQVKNYKGLYGKATGLF